MLDGTAAASTFSIGVDLGGTSLRISALTGDGERLNSSSLPTRVSDGPDAVVSDICDGIRQSLSAAGALTGNSHGLSFRGIGLGSPGPLALPEGRLLHLPNFPGWDGFELKEAVEANLGMPVIVESDANAAALAEWLRGAGKELDVDSLCMLTLGTGVGNGIILNRRIWHGMNGMGGEAGHVPILPDGVACGCGGTGCLEMYASATGLRRLALERAHTGDADGLAQLVAEKPGFMARDVAKLAEAGDRDAIRLFDDLGRHIGLGLAGLINTLNVPLYVVGGGLASSWHLFAPEMFRTVRHYSYVYRLSEPRDPKVPEPKKTSIVPALLGPDAGIIGAAMLPYSDTF
jgi:glucokinase